MPIELPNLDDRRFKELVEEGKRLIPAHAPSWTDHNPSDPGITFIELFAFIAEMLIYRVDRISEDNKRVFVKLLLGEEPDKNASIDSEIQRAIKLLRTEERAVTPADFERLAMKVPDVAVARAHCLPLRNLESGEPNAVEEEAISHVSIIVVPAQNKDTQVIVPALNKDAQQRIKAYLQRRSLLATRLHVVPAKYLKIGVRLTVHIFSDRFSDRNEKGEDGMKDRIHVALMKYFSPFEGGISGNGWPLGQSVYVSDLYAVLDQVEGVDYIERVDNNHELYVVDGEDSQERDLPEKVDSKFQFFGLSLKADELIALNINEDEIEIVRSETEQFD